MASIQKTYNSMGLPMNINRSNPIPIDNTELWYSLAEAQDYAQNDPRAYVGQTIKVVDEASGEITAYTIAADGSLVDKVEELNSLINGVSELVGDTAVSEQINNAIDDIRFYIFNIDYNKLFAFDTNEIVVDFSTTTSKLGVAVLGQMILGKL